MANSVFTIMVKYGGPSFAFRIFPVAKLDTLFVYEQANNTIQLIKDAGEIVKTVITDGSRTNQKDFKSFPSLLGLRRMEYFCCITA